MESKLLKTAIASTGSSCPVDGKGSNSQKLDFKNKTNTIKAYFLRKYFKIKNSTKGTNTSPKQKYRSVEQSIQSNVQDHNRFIDLVDELELLDNDIRTGEKEIEVIEEKSKGTFSNSKGTESTDFKSKTESNRSNVESDLDKNYNYSGNVTRNAGGNGSNGQGKLPIFDGDYNKAEGTNEFATKDVLGVTKSDSEVETTLKDFGNSDVGNEKLLVKYKKIVRFSKADNELTKLDVANFNNKVKELLTKEELRKVNKHPITGQYLMSDIISLVPPKFELNKHVDEEMIDAYTTVDNDCETNDNSVETNAVDSKLYDNQELFKVPKRKEINEIIKNKKYFKAHSRLLSYLRCKSFLKFRDASLMQQLVHQANVWMVKEGYELDEPIHYTVIANAVTVAFLISREELEFRQAIKHRVNWDNMKHLNSTIAGDLGKVYRMPSEGSFARDHLESLSLSKPNTTV